jgi:hypothetical protein
MVVLNSHNHYILRKNNDGMVEIVEFPFDCFKMEEHDAEVGDGKVIAVLEDGVNHHFVLGEFKAEVNSKDFDPQEIWCGDDFIMALQKSYKTFYNKKVLLIDGKIKIEENK